MKITRWIVQFGFLALVLSAVFVFRANCEVWCPFGGVEAIYTYAAEGNMPCSLGVSNFYILGGVLVMTLLLRRAFCGYACPIGTISEWLFSLGRLLRLPKITVTGKTDRGLALLKYVLLAVILGITWYWSELLFRKFDPCYALISRHGTDITYWAYVVAGTIVAASLIVITPFCRWFCPLAAVLNPLSRFGLTRVKRNEHVCGDCGLCSKACPAAIEVDRLEQVTAARCIACTTCVDVCPRNGRDATALVWGPPRWLGGKWPRGVLVAVMGLCIAAAVTTAALFPMPSFVRTRGTRPESVATVELTVSDLTCRGRANLLCYFLERDDDLAVPGYLKVEAWPGPGDSAVRITYDPSKTRDKGELKIKQALTEPFAETPEDVRSSPFTIEGYDIFSPAILDEMLSDDDMELDEDDPLFSEPLDDSLDLP